MWITRLVAAVRSLLQGAMGTGSLEVTVLLCVSLLLHGGDCQVRVHEVVYGWQDSPVTLECRIDTREEIKQITWEMQEGRTSKTFLTYRKDTGPIFQMPYEHRVRFRGDGNKDGSIEILNVTLSDEGFFKCVFTTFPSGTMEGKFQLQVLVLPTVRQELVEDIRTPCRNMVAECLVFSAKPAAEIQWITHGINYTTEENTIVHPNGTMSKRSQLYMMPTPELFGAEVLCLVYQPSVPSTHQKNISINNNLNNIQFPPQMVQIEVLKNDEEPMQLLCISKANPRPKYYWTRGSKFDMFPMTSATLNFTDLEGDGLYVCEASNALGVNRGYIYMHSSKCSFRCYVATFISCGIFACLLILMACYVFRSRLLKNEYQSPTKMHQIIEEVWVEKPDREEDTRYKKPTESPIKPTETSESAEQPYVNLKPQPEEVHTDQTSSIKGT